MSRPLSDSQDPMNSLSAFHLDHENTTLLQAHSASTQSYLQRNRIELAKQFQKVIGAASRLEKRLAGGEYGPINGIGVELHHKRGLIVAPIQYGLTVFVPNKLPASQLRKRRRNINKKEDRRSNSGSDFQLVKIPIAFEKIPIKVQEANAIPAVAQEAMFTNTHSTAWALQFQRPNGTSANMPIGGSPISSTPFPSLTGNSISLAESLAIQEWGTMGITCSLASGQKMGFSCAHVVDAGPVYAPNYASEKGIDSSATPSPIGNVTQSRHIPRKGVDAAIIQLDAAQVEGVLGLENSFHSLRFLAKAPKRKSSWSWLIQCKVQIRGAKTGRTVEGQISMPTVHSIEIAGKRFEDLMIVQSRSGSAAIVAPGDSGAAVLAYWEKNWYWIGMVIAMISPLQAVVSKLPTNLAACLLKPSDFPIERVWALEGERA